MNTFKKDPKQELLVNFFSAYFHEDWPCEAKTPEEVVTAYAKGTVSDEKIGILCKAILEFSRRFDDEKELEEKLFSELGCYYTPSADGLSPKEWLKRVVSQLVGLRGLRTDSFFDGGI